MTAHWKLAVYALVAACTVLSPAVYVGMDTSWPNVAHIVIAAIAAAATAATAYFTRQPK